MNNYNILRIKDYTIKNIEIEIVFINPFLISIETLKMIIMNSDN